MGCEDYVGWVLVCVKFVLVFREQDVRKNFFSDGEQGDIVVVVVGVFGFFVFVEVDDGGVFEFLWQFFLGLYGGEEVGEVFDQFWVVSSVDFYRNGVSIRCFVVGEMFDCFCDFSFCWWVSQ